MQDTNNIGLQTKAEQVVVYSSNEVTTLLPPIAPTATNKYGHKLHAKYLLVIYRPVQLPVSHAHRKAKKYDINIVVVIMIAVLCRPTVHPTQLTPGQMVC